MSESIDGSDPAFPCPTGSDGGVFQTGMTMRQYYAGLAMQGLLASGKRVCEYSEFWLAERSDLAAELAVEHADALIAELNKDQTQ